MHGACPHSLADVNDHVDGSSDQSDGTLTQSPSIGGPNIDLDILPTPHPTPQKEHGSECDRRVDELKCSYERLLGEKDVRIGELKKEKDAQIGELRRERNARLEELVKERDSRIEDIRREKAARIEEVKRERDARIKEVRAERDARVEEVRMERDVRIEDMRREKDARVEELKRDREVVVTNWGEQAERYRQEVMQLREENDKLKDEVARLKVQIGASMPAPAAPSFSAGPLADRCGTVTIHVHKPT